MTENARTCAARSRRRAETKQSAYRSHEHEPECERANHRHVYQSCDACDGESGFEKSDGLGCGSELLTEPHVLRGSRAQFNIERGGERSLQRKPVWTSRT